MRGCLLNFAPLAAAIAFYETGHQSLMWLSLLVAGLVFSTAMAFAWAVKTPANAPPGLAGLAGTLQIILAVIGLLLWAGGCFVWIL
jgi:hypothetical protein